MPPPTPLPNIDTPIKSDPHNTGSTGTLLSGILLGFIIGGSAGVYLGAQVSGIATFINSLYPTTPSVTTGLPPERIIETQTAVGSTSTASDTPEPNPMQDVKTNPYDEVKTNPFQ